MGNTVLSGDLPRPHDVSWRFGRGWHELCGNNWLAIEGEAADPSTSHTRFESRYVLKAGISFSKKGRWLVGTERHRSKTEQSIRRSSPLRLSRPRVRPSRCFAGESARIRPHQ